MPRAGRRGRTGRATVRAALRLRQRPRPARGGDRHRERRAARQLPAGVQPHRPDHRGVRDRQGARPRVSETSRKRLAALESAGPFQTSDPADVRWLLCGGGRPVAAGTAPYAVRVTSTEALVLYQDIEASRIAADERWEELGYEPAPYPWHERAPNGLPQPDFSGLRRSLSPEELERYRAAGRDAAE